jgi:hypothetical protein
MTKKSHGCCVLVVGCAGLVAACSSDTTDGSDTTEEPTVSTGGMANWGPPGSGVVSQGGSVARGGSDDATGGEPRSLGYIGCSMSVNVAQGYEALGGERLWPPTESYMGMVVQNWANTNDSVWQAFDQQAADYGLPSAVWVQICIFSFQGATYDEVTQLIANARQHAAPDATIYITGQPLYESGWTCDLAGADGPQLTDDLAGQAAVDSTQNAIYAGTFGPLGQATTSDNCHANQAGQQLLGAQAIEYFGE